MENARRTQADRTAATRAALIDAGRQLFAEHGFAGVGTEAIVRDAGVSRGALYHHFGDKTELFAAVLDQLEETVAGELTTAALADPEAGFVDIMDRTFEAWLDACARTEVQRIVLLDGPSVLGWARWREICQPHILGLVEAALDRAVADGTIAPQPVRPLAHILLAAGDEAAMYVATAADSDKARQEMLDVSHRIVTSLTVPKR